MLSHSGAPVEALERLDHAFGLSPNLAQWHRSIYIVANFNARRYDEAVAMWEKLNEPPIYFYRWIATTYAHMGCIEEARKVGAKYFQAYPNFNFTDHLLRMPFRHEEDRAHYRDGLAKAGIGHIVDNVAG